MADPPLAQFAGAGESRFRILFENSPLSLWEEDWSEVRRRFQELAGLGVCDFRTWFQQHPDDAADCLRRIRVVQVNQATLDLFAARDKDELVRNLPAIFAPHSRDASARVLAALAEGARHFHFETPLQSVSGQTLHVALYANVAPGYEDTLGMVLVSFLDITERKEAEDAIRGEHERLRQMLEFVEHERRILGYEIHDGLAQQLAGALLLFQAFGERRRAMAEATAAAGPDPGETFDAAVQLLREAIAESRRLIDDLRPMILEEAGLLPALEEVGRQCRARWGLDVEFVWRVTLPRFAPHLETAIFRIVQESLTNVRRHSRAKRARVELAEQGGRLRLEVRDWGAGFDTRLRRPGHYGLEGIRERARLLGGKAAIESAPDQGTRVIVDLPVILGE